MATLPNQNTENRCEADFAATVVLSYNSRFTSRQKLQRDLFHVLELATKTRRILTLIINGENVQRDLDHSLVLVTEDTGMRVLGTRREFEEACNQAKEINPDYTDSEVIAAAVVTLGTEIISARSPVPPSLTDRFLFNIWPHKQKQKYIERGLTNLCEDLSMKIAAFVERHLTFHSPCVPSLSAPQTKEVTP